MNSASDAFLPVNDLERALVEAQEGRLPVDSFLEALHASQVFILLDKDPGASGWDNSALPMVLNNQQGIPVLAVFSSPERSKIWTSRQPSFSYGMLTDFKWLLKGIASTVGVVLNPGESFGLELSPERVSNLKNKAS